MYSIARSVLGGTCAVPGAFGCGKTVISQVGKQLLLLLLLLLSHACCVSKREVTHGTAVYARRPCLSTPTRTASFTWAVASAVTRWQRC